ncbi:MAG: FMN-binding glutamate synthase family protein, partial [Planctomycetes bacterium]|nr:FMN-binding glutamate synthase family protein [Planctomycetota bacterium]
KDVISPPAHSRFSTPHELIDFIEELRELSDGKPVGIKLCVGKRREFLALCKAMHKRGVVPDFIAVDGAEGGTGAAPLEFSNHIGCPLSEGLIFIHNSLVGIGVREEIRIISSGKIASAFDIIKRLALGADICYSARAFMMSLGCIQALRCNHNDCPTGVATQKQSLINGLVVSDKNKRVSNYHDATVEGVAEMLGAMGLSHSEDLRPWHIMRRVNSFTVHHYGEIYNYLKDGALLEKMVPEDYRRAWESSTDEKFDFNGEELKTRKYHSKKRKAL